MARDWFRSTEWTPEVEAEFDVRLQRARKYKRPQYLRVQGVTLKRAGDVETARELWLRVLDEEDNSESASALEHLADSWTLEDPARAIDYYRTMLAKFPDLKSTSFTAPIKFAELLLDRGGPSDIVEADAALAFPLGIAPLPDMDFRRQVALARLGRIRGDNAAVRSAAQTALELAAKGPIFTYHPNVGLVDTDAKTLQQLRRLVRFPRLAPIPQLTTRG
ncbi:tetratricopeptide repeat protein [Gordonia sp. (in: high G+C Gram-positive bacteria)]|uniref:tetratricopeptide repeat protein n=1 Tax=Gordonia sp. (in: high G+C Gram-positive bacteria) TaxID=84139 RepID=UPI003C71DF17